MSLVLSQVVEVQKEKASEVVKTPDAQKAAISCGMQMRNEMNTTKTDAISATPSTTGLKNVRQILESGRCICMLCPRYQPSDPLADHHSEEPECRRNTANDFYKLPERFDELDMSELPRGFRYENNDIYTINAELGETQYKFCTGVRILGLSSDPRGMNEALDVAVKATDGSLHVVMIGLSLNDFDTLEALSRAGLYVYGDLGRFFKMFNEWEPRIYRTRHWGEELTN